MGGKVAKPVIEPITVRSLLGSNIELFTAEFYRLVRATWGQNVSARPQISKPVLYAHFLEPKLSQHFSSKLLDRVFAVACPTYSEQNGVTEDEFVVFYYLCYHAHDDLLMKFIFNMCDTSASDSVSTKEMEKFLLQLYLPQQEGKIYPTDTSTEQKEPVLRSLASILADAMQLVNLQANSGQLTFDEWRAVFDGDYRVQTLARCLRTSPQPLIQRNAAAKVTLRSQQSAGVHVPTTHEVNFFVDRPIPDDTSF